MPDMISYKIVQDALNLPLPSTNKNGQFRPANNADQNNSKSVSSSSDYTRFRKQITAYKNR